MFTDGCDIRCDIQNLAVRDRTKLGFIELFLFLGEIVLESRNVSHQMDLKAYIA